MRETIQPAAVPTGHSRHPRFSVSQVSTLPASFAEDVETYAKAGLDGIGIWELKLADGGDREALEALDRSGLGRAVAVPDVPSILPLPVLPGPPDPRERIAAYRASIRRLAAFRPAGLVCLTGPAGDLDPVEARRIVVAGLRELAAEAEQAGVAVALEPYQRDGMESWSLINTISEAVELIEEVGSPAVGIQFDVWHLWNTPDLLDEIEREAHRFLGVHISDYRSPTRGFADRLLPGDGVADVAPILRALDRAGWSGYYDLEVFSDNGAWGTVYPDALWDVPPAELVARARAAFTGLWEAAAVA
jgi:sugar phosphate isomerase/epimerase